MGSCFFSRNLVFWWAIGAGTAHDWLFIGEAKSFELWVGHLRRKSEHRHARMLDCSGGTPLAHQICTLYTNGTESKQTCDRFLLPPLTLSTSSASRWINPIGVFYWSLTLWGQQQCNWIYKINPYWNFWIIRKITYTNMSVSNYVIGE